MKTMKKLAALLLALSLALALAACSSQNTPSSAAPSQGTEESSAPSEANEPAQGSGEYATVEDGKLIMATNCHFPPYEMVADGAGVHQGYEGIDIEIAKALADALGLELVIDDMEFTSALLAVQENRADMILAGLTYKPDRDEVMDFSTSYATGVQVVIVPEGSDIETPDDLADGKLIGTQRGTTGYIYCSDTPENGGYGEENVLAYDNGALAVQALLNGQIDAVVIDNGPAQEYVAANPGLVILDTEYVTEDYCLAVNEGNAQLLDVLNTILETMIDNGLIDEIVSHYISAE